MLVASPSTAELSVRILNGTKTLAEAQVPAASAAGPLRRATVALPGDPSRVGLAIEAEDGRGVRAATAIHVGRDWSLAPRYGFFSEFDPPEREEALPIGSLLFFNAHGTQ